MSIGAISGIMGGYGNLNVGAAQGSRGPQRFDDKEAEVAKKLGMDAKEFQKLSEDEKSQKVEEYNRVHPEDPIDAKGKRAENAGFQDGGNNPMFQNSAIQQFHSDVNWSNVQLER